MDNLTMFNLIVGFVSPIIIATIASPSWGKKARVTTTVAFSVITGGLIAFFGGEFNGVDITTSILITLVASITFYKGVFKPAGITQSVEAKTSKKVDDVSLIVESSGPKHRAEG